MGCTILTLGLRSKETPYFYGTGYILYPPFQNYFLNFFFKSSINRLNCSQNVAFIQISHFFYEIIYSETLKMFEDKKI